jgi:hypothetical protein
VQDYAVNSAISSATQQVNDLNRQGLDEAQRRQQADMLARDLALQLTGVGASGQQIQSAFQAIAPPAANDYLSLFGQGVQSGSDTMKKQAAEWKKFANEDKMAMAQMQMQRDMVKMQQKNTLQNDQRFSKLVEKQSTTYAGWANKLGDTETKLATLEDGLIRNDNAIIQGASPTIIAKAMGEVGALTEADKAPYQGSQAIANRIEQLWATAKNGKLSDSNRKLMLQLVKQLRTTTEQRKKNNAKILSSQLSKHATKILGVPLSEDEASSYITGMDAEATTSEQQGNPLDAFLKVKGK